MCVEIQVSASQPVIWWVYFYLKCFKVRGFKKKTKQGLLHWIDERIHVQRNNQARTKDTGQLSGKMDAGSIHYFCACFTVSIKCVSAYKHSKITSCIELTENFNKNEKKNKKNQTSTRRCIHHWSACLWLWLQSMHLKCPCALNTKECEVPFQHLCVHVYVCLPGCDMYRGVM